MELQLRSLVLDSLHDFVDFLASYETGNDFGTDYHDLMFVLPQVRGRSEMVDRMSVWYVWWRGGWVGMSYKVLYSGILRQRKISPESNVS